jgi:hypothetical protein
MAELRRILETCVAAGALSPGDGLPKLESSMEAPATADEIGAAWPHEAVPDALEDLWAVARSATLFEDTEFGQWGLHVLSPEESAEQSTRLRKMRMGDYRPGDVVWGTFLGDQDLLLIDGRDGRSVLVATPLDHRDEWIRAAPALQEFLQRYIEASGEKYWES